MNWTWVIKKSCGLAVNITFYSTVKYSNAGPTYIVIHGSQVIYIEINWYTALCLTCRVDFGEQTETRRFATGANRLEGVTLFLRAELHIYFEDETKTINVLQTLSMWNKYTSVGHLTNKNHHNKSKSMLKHWYKLLLISFTKQK